MTVLCEEDLDLHNTAEVHWSTGTILAVFFASSLISAVIFGLGYSFGKGGSPNPAVASAIAPAVSQSSPSAGLFFWRRSSHAAASSHAPAATQDRWHENLSQAGDSARRAPDAFRQVSDARANATVNGDRRGYTMVQVGASANRKEAEKLLVHLRKKGFHARIYRGSHDRFLHIEIGPYKSEQQAQSMRHRLIASGYHAILKTAS